MKESLSFFDQMGNGIKLSSPPVRIVSLVPSQTELLFDLGLDKEVVGITKYCVHPPHWQNEKTIVGGTKNFDIEIIDSLKPHLIIGNREENIKELILELHKKHTLWMSEIYTVEDALQMIEGVGMVTDRYERSKEITAEIRKSFESIVQLANQKVLYLIWRKPWMAAGKNTFINSMLEKIGLDNCLPELSRYPELTNEDMIALNPDIVFLSSEPFPFKEKHIEEIQTILPKAKIFIVDGEMFSWYGSRLRQAGTYFNSLVFDLKI